VRHQRVSRRAGGALLGPEADGEAVLVRADKAMYVRKTAWRAEV